MADSDSALHTLLQRLENGDETALGELFAVHRDRLWRMIHFRLDRRLCGRVDADDVLQEAYLDAAKRVQHFIRNPNMSFFVWLRQVAIQRMIDVHRRHLDAQMRDAKQEVPIHRGHPANATSASMASQLIGHLTSPSQRVLRAELLDQVEIALERMDAIDREVLALRHFEQLTNNEIAEVLGVTKAAASNRYVRALSRLRDVLAKVPGFFGEADGR